MKRETLNLKLDDLTEDEFLALLLECFEPRSVDVKEAIMEDWGLPDQDECERLGIPAKLYCRRSHVVNSRIGVCGKAFDKMVAAGTIERVVLPGETYGRHYTAQVLEVLVK